MQKARQTKGRPQGDMAGTGLGRFEYDRADEKRKINEEIDDFLTERIEKKTPAQQDMEEKQE